MYCVECGAKLDDGDKYCFSCGTPVKKGADFAPLKKYIKKPRSKEFKFNFYVLAVILVVLLVPIALLLFSNRGERTAFAIKIANMPSAIQMDSQDGIIRECEKCERIEIKQGDKMAVFEMKKNFEDQDGLRRHLIELAKQNDGREGLLSIFDEARRDRIIDISLDISGSIINKDKRDKERGSPIVYSDLLLNKLDQKLSSSQGLAPGDSVIVRLWGPDFVANPCKGELYVKYLGPQWQAKFAYSIRTRQALIEIKESVNKTDRDGNSLVTTELPIIIEEIKKFYKNALVNPNKLCHEDTLLDQHIGKIVDDVRLDQYRTRNFILINDGEFSFASSYITPRSYAALQSYIDAGKPLKINDKTICRSSEDAFTLIGLDFANHPLYRAVLQKFFEAILNPCKINFENL